MIRFCSRLNARNSLRGGNDASTVSVSLSNITSTRWDGSTVVRICFIIDLPEVLVGHDYNLMTYRLFNYSVHLSRSWLAEATMDYSITVLARATWSLMEVIMIISQITAMSYVLNLSAPFCYSCGLTRPFALLSLTIFVRHVLLSRSPALSMLCERLCRG